LIALLPASITGAMSRAPGHATEPDRLAAVLRVEAGELPVRLRVSPRARQITIRLDPALDGVELVLPLGVPAHEGRRFLDERRDWIADRLARIPPRVRFAPGAAVPYLGAEHRVVHRREQRQPVCRTAGEIAVGGHREHMGRRLGDWLKAEARRVITPLVGDKAASLGDPWTTRPPRVAVRDPRRQWGSCSTRGTLSFSWRLIMAPEAVIDYVVAHEVAHLRQANHGRGFWALVAELTADVGGSRAWLRGNGAKLHRYG
jgi:predicted metal-dependent hydrolase